jgi:pyruvate,water dikinase
MWGGCFMKAIVTNTTSPSESIPGSITGIKADILTQLSALGLQVPEWMLIPSTIFSEYIPESILEHPSSEVISFIRNIKLDSALIDSIHNWIHTNGIDNELFAVRSSICIDKSCDHTFAGQLKTNLCVPLNELPEAIIDVWTSPFSSKAAAYRAQWGISQKSIRIAVILQKMIPTESSGVAMCFDPSNGSRSNITITSCYGINTNSSAARTDCDQFTVNFSGEKPSRISRVYEKKNRVIPDQLSGSGTTLGPVPWSIRSKSSLTSREVMALATITRATSIKTGKPQILDWVLSKGKFYILQTRTVISLKNIPDTTEKEQVWQTPANPLIATESIPPLTYSIIKRFNADAYRSFCIRPGLKRLSRKLKNDFDFLAYINGHVYIDKSIYDQIIQSLPFDSLAHAQSKRKLFVNNMISHLLLFFDYYNNNKNCKNLLKDISNETDLKCKSFPDCTFRELLNIYLQLESQMGMLWKSLVINEHYLSTINSLYFNKGENSTRSIYDFSKTGHSLGSNLLPDEIKNIAAVAEKIDQNQSVKTLFEQNSSHVIRKELGLDAAIPPTTMDISCVIIRKMILHLLDNYNSGVKDLTEFNNTCNNLNNIIDIIRLYVTQPVTIGSLTKSDSYPESDIRTEDHAAPIKPFHNRCLYALLQRLHSQRQTLNKIKNVFFNRLKRLFLLLGKKFYSEGILESVDDLQFLTRDEIKDYISGRSVTSSLKLLVNIRKQDFLSGEKQAEPDSFFTHGIVYHSPSQSRLQSDTNQTISLFQGFGNRTSSVSGEIKIAESTSDINSLKNTILVVRDCNPKWIACLPFIKGLIIENGSIFSELSLACYRLNIPLVFSRDRYSEKFNNGDRIELDSHSGNISLISRFTSQENPFM